MKMIAKVTGYHPATRLHLKEGEVYDIDPQKAGTGEVFAPVTTDDDTTTKEDS